MATYPLECCGLIVGTVSGTEIEVTEVRPSKNLTSGDPTRSFELDPKLRFDVMREMESRDDSVDIIGHYHSHPDGPAAPSATDLSMVYEPQMIWLICRVSRSGTTHIGAFKPKADASAFDRLPIAKGT